MILNRETIWQLIDELQVLIGRQVEATPQQFVTHPMRVKIVENIAPWKILIVTDEMRFDIEQGANLNLDDAGLSVKHDNSIYDFYLRFLSTGQKLANR